MLTVEEVAKELRVDQKTVRRWIQRGELVAIDIGREYRISAHFVKCIDKADQPIERI